MVVDAFALWPGRFSRLERSTGQVPASQTKPGAVETRRAWPRASVDRRRLVDHVLRSEHELGTRLVGWLPNRADPPAANHPRQDIGIRNACKGRLVSTGDTRDPGSPRTRQLVCCRYGWHAAHVCSGATRRQLLNGQRHSSRPLTDAKTTYGFAFWFGRGSVTGHRWSAGQRQKSKSAGGSLPSWRPRFLARQRPRCLREAP